MAAYLDIFSGNADQHEQETAEYNATCSLVSKHSAVFNLPTLPELLSDEQRGILQDLNVLYQTRTFSLFIIHSCFIYLRNPQTKPFALTHLFHSY